MANQEHLDILKRGVEVWNQWRREHPDIPPNLGEADLRQANLGDANLGEGFLLGVNFSMANLRGANLSNSGLRGANFMATNLSRANLSRTNLWDTHYGNLNIGYADLSEADLSHAQLGGVDLSHANFTGANFTGADLGGVNLSSTALDRADFTNTVMAGTTLGDHDLRLIKGLETVQHRFPSPLSMNTIIRSHGHIPESFLRGVGVPNSIIEQIPALIDSLKPIDYYSCFISYSSKDEDFAKRLYADLQNNGVRCWFAPHDLRPGQRIRHGIDEAIRMYDKLLLILSEYSVASTWVEFEVEAAMDKEKNGSEVLFPVRLDAAVLGCAVPWAAHLKRTRHIGDFTHWKQHDDYQQAFTRLLRDLKAEEQKSRENED